MKKIDFPLLSDILFFFACSLLVSLCILRYLDITMWQALLYSSLISVMLSVGLFFLLYGKRKKKMLLKKDKEEKEKLLLHLALSSKQENLKLFAPLLKEQNKQIYLLFSLQPLSADILAEKIKLHKNTESFCIFCNALSPEAKRLCVICSLDVKEGNEVYAMLKEENLLPQQYLYEPTKKQKLREKLKISFHKKNSRSFFVSGAAILVLSLFSFFPLYYIISGCILIFTALIVRIFGYT